MNEWVDKKRRKYVRHANINKYRVGWIMEVKWLREETLIHYTCEYTVQCMDRFDVWMEG